MKLMTLTEFERAYEGNSIERSDGSVDQLEIIDLANRAALELKPCPLQRMASWFIEAQNAFYDELEAIEWFDKKKKKANR